MRSARVSPNQGGQNSTVSNGVKPHDNVQKIAVLPDTNANTRDIDARNGKPAPYPKSILRKETRYPSSNGRPSGLFDYLQRIFNPEFDSPALEKTYRHYFSGQKYASLVFLVVAAVVVNFVLVIIHSVNFGRDRKLHTTRIIVSTLFLILNATILLLVFCCRRRGPNHILPRFAWICFFFELILDRCLNYSPITPTDSVGLFLFFIYLTYSLLPFRLYSCVISCLTTAVIHCVLTLALTAEKSSSTKSLV